MSLQESMQAMLWPETDPDSCLAREIVTLATLDRHCLRILWRKTMRRNAPEHLGRALLVRLLAWRLQAHAHGDLDNANLAVLSRLLGADTARRKDRTRIRSEASTGPRGSTKPRETTKPQGIPQDRDAQPEPGTANRKANAPARSLRAGTMLFREFNGEVHRVRVLRDGYEWREERFRSLSEVARRITGTNWNGPRFFGLREKARKAATARTARLVREDMFTEAVTVRRDQGSVSSLLGADSVPKPARSGLTARSPRTHASTADIEETP